MVGHRRQTRPHRSRTGHGMSSTLLTEKKKSKMSSKEYTGESQAEKEFITGLKKHRLEVDANKHRIDILQENPHTGNYVRTGYTATIEHGKIWITSAKGAKLGPFDSTKKALIGLQVMGLHVPAERYTGSKKGVVNFSGKYIKAKQRDNIKYRDKEIALNKRLLVLQERKRVLLNKLGEKNLGANKESKAYKKTQEQYMKLGDRQEKILKQAQEATKKHIQAYKDYNYALEDNYYVKSDQLETKIKRLEAENEKEFTFKRDMQIKRAKKFNEDLKREARINHQLAEQYNGESSMLA